MFERRRADEWATAMQASVTLVRAQTMPAGPDRDALAERGQALLHQADPRIVAVCSVQVSGVIATAAFESGLWPELDDPQRWAHVSEWLEAWIWTHIHETPDPPSFWAGVRHLFRVITSG